MSTHRIYDDTGRLWREIEYNDPNDLTKGYTVQSHEDVSGLLKQTEMEREAGLGRKGTDTPKLGNIPKAALEQALREGWLLDMEKWKQWFRDNRKFVVYEGKF